MLCTFLTKKVKYVTTIPQTIAKAIKTISWQGAITRSMTTNLTQKKSLKSYFQCHEITRLIASLYSQIVFLGIMTMSCSNSSNHETLSEFGMAKIIFETSKAHPNDFPIIFKKYLLSTREATSIILDSLENTRKNPEKYKKMQQELQNIIANKIGMPKDEHKTKQNNQ